MTVQREEGKPIVISSLWGTGPISVGTPDDGISREMAGNRGAPPLVNNAKCHCTHMPWGQRKNPMAITLPFLAISLADSPSVRFI